MKSFKQFVTESNNLPSKISISDLNLEVDMELLGEYVLPRQMTIKLSLNEAPIDFLKTLTNPIGQSISSCFKTAEAPQIEHVKNIIKNFKSMDWMDKIIVLYGNILIDGYHRTMAAIKLNKPLYYIDLKELED